MNRGLILQMLNKLPPERLGQLISEVQGNYVVDPQFSDEQAGLQGRRMQQRDMPDAYKDLPRRTY